MAKILNGSNFIFSAKNKTMIAEASELNMNQFPSVISIRSHRTKKIAFFAHKETIRNNDNEIEKFIYEPMTSGLDGWTVHIFND